LAQHRQPDNAVAGPIIAIVDRRRLGSVPTKNERSMSAPRVVHTEPEPAAARSPEAAPVLGDAV
jgi:hypothetical protein